MIGYLLPSRAATVQTLGHPAAGVIGWFDSASNVAGVQVTASTALTFAAVWCAVRVISETLASLPCILYRKVSDDSRERAVDDPRYWLVHDEPNPMMNAVTWFETQTADLLLRGNSFSRIVMQGQGKIPSRFEPRSPDNVGVVPMGDTVEYRVSNPTEYLRASEMFHVLGLGGDGIQGWSVIKYAQQSLGAALAGDQYTAGMYGNGQTLGGILQIPTRLDKPARELLRKEWEETHKGSANSGRIAIMHGGMEFKPTSMSNEDAQFLESRQFSIREIARWFRLPPHMLADLQDSSVRANIEQQAIEFIVYSLRPWLVRWQQTLNRKLLTREERRTLYFEFLLDALLSGDTPSRNAAYATARQWGWMSVNDIRRRENMNTIDGGDVYLQPSNMVPAGSVIGTVPDTITQEFQRSMAESIQTIVDQARKIYADIVLGMEGAYQAIGQYDETCRAILRESREVREEIRQDIASLGKVQSRGWTDERAAMVDACNDLFRVHMAGMLRIEKAEVIKAAKSVSRGQNFMGWLDHWYPDHAARVGEKGVAIFLVLAKQGMTLGISPPWDAWCIRHKTAMIAAADGDPATFVDRVQAEVDTWDAELKELKLA